MSRPKKGTKEAEEATRKWRETMQRKYGGAAGVHNMMSRIGRLGGARGFTGGFAANPELAKQASAKGGRISKRGKSLTKEIEKNAPEIIRMYNQGLPITEIAKKVGISYGRVRYWIRNNL